MVVSSKKGMNVNGCMFIFIIFFSFREIKKYHFVDLSRLVIMGSGVGGHIAARVLAEDSG